MKVASRNSMTSTIDFHPQLKMSAKMKNIFSMMIKKDKTKFNKVQRRNHNMSIDYIQKQTAKKMNNNFRNSAKNIH